MTAAPAVDELAPERGKEAFAQCIVVTIAHRSHGRVDAGQLAPRPKGDRGILRALIGMMDDVLWPALSQRHLEGVEHEPCAKVRGHGPADHASAEGVQHDRELEEPGPAGNVGVPSAAMPVSTLAIDSAC